MLPILDGQNGAELQHHLGIFLQPLGYLDLDLARRQFIHNLVSLFGHAPLGCK